MNANTALVIDDDDETMEECSHCQGCGHDPDDDFDSSSKEAYEDFYDMVEKGKEKVYDDNNALITDKHLDYYEILDLNALNYAEEHWQDYSDIMEADDCPKCDGTGKVDWITAIVDN
jgi:hypothetical protein